MRELIKRNIGGWKVLLFFILAIIIYVLMLTITIPKVMSFSGGLKILDMMPAGYTPEYVNTLLNALGEAGRNAYLYNQIPLDLMYPLLFGVGNCLILAYFLNKMGKLEGNLFYLCLVPLFAGLFDYLENSGIITLLITYPENSVVMSQITNIFSILKSIATTLYFIIVIIVLIAFGIREFVKQ